MVQEKYNKLFVGGDLSGIQKFLYNITSRHASVSLKGRSAFLSNYLRKVCNRIEDTVVGYGGTFDELYCSGGKFYLITDNTPTVIKAIDDCAKDLKEKLWNDYKGQLGVNISHVAYREEDCQFHVEGYEDDQNTSSGVLWKYCNADFARQKNQKFRDLILSRPNKFFGFMPKNEVSTDNLDYQELIVGKEHKVCALTGVESPDCRPLTKEDFEKEGLSLKEFDEEKDENNLSENVPVYLPSVIEQIVLGKKLSIQNNTKEFEYYATTDYGRENGIKGDTYLGVLRMDVDGMGKKFIIGFLTLKDYTDFSNRATQFFERDVKTTFLKPYEKYLNVIYAGGDDLFIVGRWDKVIEFAKFIHDKVVEEFCNDGYEDIFSKEKKWCNISISGGIAIVKPKFPIAKAADMAGEAEDAAKQGEKNAFNMFGKTISWNKDKTFAVIEDQAFDEYEYVEYYKNLFVEYISQYNKDYGFSKSILHKIMLYSEIADMNIEREAKGKSKNYSYMWHISYYMTRFMDKYKNYGDNPVKKKLYKFCRSLRDEQLCKRRNLELLAVSARWAELILKDNESN